MSNDANDRLNALNAKIDAWAKGPGRKFQCFDPVLTFSNPSNDRFIASNGKPSNRLNRDSSALFDLGLEAFSRLSQGTPLGESNFDEGYRFYWSFLDCLRDMLDSAQSVGNLQLKYRNQPEDHSLVDINLLDESQVISIAWKLQLNFDAPDKSDDFMMSAFWLCFLYHVLREIDNSQIAMAIDDHESVAAAIAAANALANAISIESGSKREQQIRREMAYKGALEKLKNDPKQAAKAEVKDCWMAWQKRPETYKGKSAFAKGMMEKYEALDSQVVITRWCSQWEKERGD